MPAIAWPCVCPLQEILKREGVFFIQVCVKKIKPSELKLDLTERKEKKNPPQMQLLACLTEQTLTSLYHLYKRLVGLNYLKHAFPFFFFSSNIIILKMMSKVYLFVEGMELLF